VRLIREINIIKQVDHPFIAKLFDVITTDQYTYLIQEYAQCGNLLNYVNDCGRLPEVHARRYFTQLVSALEYLHEERKVAHRDLKAENVLLDRNFNIRLIDFGISNCFTSEDATLQTACGSPAYCAPEIICGQPYTKSVDIWSSGVLLYAMLCGELPFDDESSVRLLQKVAWTEPEYPSYLSPPVSDLLHKLLTKNPDHRITIARIKTHPWFSHSEYAKFLQFRLTSDDTWLVRAVDREIVDRIAAMGLDVKDLVPSLLSGSYTETTAIYSMLRRNILTDKFRDRMLQIAEGALQEMRRSESLGQMNQPKSARESSMGAAARPSQPRRDLARPPSRAALLPPRKPRQDSARAPSVPRNS
jgi:serine/threonine protein kinase